MTVTPLTGKGTVTVSVSTTPHTGREGRKATYKAFGLGEYSYLESNNFLVVEQKGKPGFIIQDGTPPDLTAEDTLATLKFRSNLEILSLTLPVSSGATLESAKICNVILSSTAREELTSSGYAVVDGNGVEDPGKYAEYEIEIVLRIGENQSSSQRVIPITFGDEDFRVVQPGGETPSTTVAFTSNVVGDTNSDGDVVLSLNASGNGYSDGVTRQINISVNPEEAIGWLVDTEITYPDS